MYTREEWDRQRNLVKKVQQRAGNILARFAVPGGLAQLLFGRWADRNLDRATRTPLELGIFLVYMIGVGLLLWRYVTAVNAVRPKCPNCATVFKDMSEQVASATGRCEKCGGQVIAS